MDGEWAAEEVYALSGRLEGPIRNDLRTCLLLELRHGMASRTAHVPALSTERTSAACSASEGLSVEHKCEDHYRPMILSTVGGFTKWRHGRHTIEHHDTVSHYPLGPSRAYLNFIDP